MTITSKRNGTATRANSPASTGRTSGGATPRAAPTARRHGLSVPVWSDPKLSAEVEDLASVIAGVDAGPERRTLTRAIAEAQIDLIRVRQARHALIAPIFEDPVPVLATQAAAWRHARALIRAYNFMEEQPSFLEQQPVPSELMRRALRPEEFEAFSLLSANVARSLAAMDRYERRALSRRKIAIRAFDAAPPAQAEIADLADAGAML
jgi:hypothetical protein